MARNRSGAACPDRCGMAGSLWRIQCRRRNKNVRCLVGLIMSEAITGGLKHFPAGRRVIGCCRNLKGSNGTEIPHRFRNSDGLARQRILGTMDHTILAMNDCQVAFIPIESSRSSPRGARLTQALWWTTLVDETVLRERC